METADVTRICRLCMGDLCTPTTASINLLDFPQITILIKDHYSVEILPTDGCSTSICMGCYIELQKRQDFRLLYISTKRRFRMNQLILRKQMEAFCKKTAPPPMAESVPAVTTEVVVEDLLQNTPEVADANESLEEPITEEQFEAQVAQAQEVQVTPAPTVETEPQPEATEDRNTYAASEQSDDTLDEHVVSASMDLLRPVLVDCLKEPLYLEALQPVFLSHRRDRPLDYHCHKCFQVFAKKEYLRKHLTRNTCVPNCRYCRAAINSPNHNHDCPPSRRFAAIAAQIWPTSRYRSYASNSPLTVRESDTESEASTVEQSQPANVSIRANGDPTRPSNG